MKRIILFLALLTVVGTANATGASSNCNGNGSCSQDTVNNTANQGGTGIGGTGGAGGSASAGNVGSTGSFSSVRNLSPAASTENANNAKQDTKVTVEGDTTDYEAARIPVATAYAPSVAPTAPCMGSTSGGAQGVGFGISFGLSWTSEECLILETARSFDQIQDRTSGLEVRCQAKYAKNTTACKALADKAKPVSAALDTPVAAVVSPASKKAAAQAYTPVKAVPPVVSHNGYYSVVTNPLAQ